MGTNIGGISVEYGDDYTAQYVRALESELTKIGIRKVVSHLSEVYQIENNTWYNYCFFKKEAIDSVTVTDSCQVYHIVNRNIHIRSIQLDSRGQFLYGQFEIIIIDTADCRFIGYISPEKNIVVTTDIFHVQNDGGIMLCKAIIDTLESAAALRVAGPSLDIQNKNATLILGNMVYNMVPVLRGSVDEYIGELKKQLRIASADYERRLRFRYMNALSSLKAKQEEILSKTVIAPPMHMDTISNGYYILRFQDDNSYIRLCKNSTFTLKKLWVSNRNTPINIPEEYRVNFKATVMVLLKQNLDLWRPLKAYLYSIENGSLSPVAHPHVSSDGQICTGSYCFHDVNFNEPKTITSLFDDILKLLEAVDPTSWYSSQARKFHELVNWISDNVNHEE